MYTLGVHSQAAGKTDVLDKIQCAIGNQILTSESKVLIAGNVQPETVVNVYTH